MARDGARHEYYVDLGRLSHFAPRNEQAQILYLLHDTERVNFGIGYGLTGAWIAGRSRRSSRSSERRWGLEAGTGVVLESTPVRGGEGTALAPATSPQRRSSLGGESTATKDSPPTSAPVKSAAPNVMARSFRNCLRVTCMAPLSSRSPGRRDNGAAPINSGKARAAEICPARCRTMLV